MLKPKKKILNKGTKSGKGLPAPSKPAAPEQNKPLTTEEVDQIRANEITALNNDGYFRYNLLLQLEVMNGSINQVNENLQKLGEVVENLVEQQSEVINDPEETEEGAESEEETEEEEPAESEEDGEQQPATAE